MEAGTPIMVAAEEIPASEMAALVVPREGGEPSPPAFVVQPKLDTSALPYHNPHGVWVPAFRGDDYR